jgi:hypothetical protein
VLPDPEAAPLLPDEVDARDVAADAVGRREPGDLAAELAGRAEEAPWHDAVVERAAAAVDVGEERLKDPDALPYATGQQVRLRRVDDPRDSVRHVHQPRQRFRPRGSSG